MCVLCAVNSFEEWREMFFKTGLFNCLLFRDKGKNRMGKDWVTTDDCEW